MSWLTLYVLEFSTPTAIYITEYLFIHCISMYEVGLKKYTIVAMLFRFRDESSVEVRISPHLGNNTLQTHLP